MRVEMKKEKIIVTTYRLGLDLVEVLFLDDASHALDTCQKGEVG